MNADSLCKVFPSNGKTQTSQRSTTANACGNFHHQPQNRSTEQQPQAGNRAPKLSEIRFSSRMAFRK